MHTILSSSSSFARHHPFIYFFVALSCCVEWSMKRMLSCFLVCCCCLLQCIYFTVYLVGPSTVHLRVVPASPLVGSRTSPPIVSSGRTNNTYIFIGRNGNHDDYSIRFYVVMSVVSTTCTYYHSLFVHTPSESKVVIIIEQHKSSLAQCSVVFSTWSNANEINDSSVEVCITFSYHKNIWT